MREWLKELRKNKGLTQKELADLLKISPNYVCCIENGDRKKTLDVDLACQLAELFGVTIDFILVEEQKLHKTA